MTADNSRRRLLLFSNSRNPDSRLLQHAEHALKNHLHGVKTLTFLPYAGVTISWDQYASTVRDVFRELSIELKSVHECADPGAAIAGAQAIAVGGGNTFHLLRELQRQKLLPAIRERALSGIPYVGWSAGSVVACPTLQTTNDMPIAEPSGFAALGLVQFQINAHFTDVHPPGFSGETRRQRLSEFVTANPSIPVIGLPEGDWLKVHGTSIVLEGAYDAPLFRAGVPDALVSVGSELSSMLEGAR